MPRVYGRTRLPGQLIWATRFKEKVKVTTQTTGGGQGAGGKNVPSAAGGNKVKVEEYRYFANAAYAICEGPITRVGRIWADGKELDQSKYTIRVYRGDEAQSAWLFTGGFAKGYRTQVLGLITALSAVASWAVGDASLADLVTKAPVIFGGLGLAALGVKVNDTAAKIAGAKPARAK